ncbi:hypothetical protein BDV10DRAFT_187945 [Aspergillus recurvatus]
MDSAKQDVVNVKQKLAQAKEKVQVLKRNRIISCLMRMRHNALASVERGVVDTNVLFISAGVDVTYRGLSGDDCSEECRHERGQFFTQLCPHKAKIYPVVVEVSNDESRGRVEDSVPDIELGDVMTILHDKPGHRPHGNEGRVSVPENRVARWCKDPHAHYYVAHRIEYHFAHLYRQDYYGTKAIFTLSSQSGWHEPSKRVFGTYSDRVPTSYDFGNPGWFVQRGWVHHAAPHQLFIVASPVPEQFEGGILEGELTTLFMAMIKQYKSKDKYLRRQEIMPVMMVSVIGYVARILHAYFDGAHVHLWVSEPVNPSSMAEEDGYDFFARYLASYPIGDTGVLRCERLFGSVGREEKRRKMKRKRTAGEDGFDEVEVGEYVKLKWLSCHD